VTRELRAVAAWAVCLLAVPAAAPAADQQQFVPGSYAQIDTVTKKPLPVGSRIVIMAGKAGQLGFSINAVRQSDSNLGFIAGLLPAALPAVWTHNSDAGNCKLTFEKVPGGLRVTQDAAFGDCGFGYGVSASGTYMLVAQKP
jgi:hypothetical protein